MTKVVLYLLELMNEYPERNPKQLASWGAYSYADALYNKVSQFDIFSCSDPIFLAYRDEMQKEFKMEILTVKEAEDREKEEHFRKRAIDISEDIDRLLYYSKTKRYKK